MLKKTTSLFLAMLMVTSVLSVFPAQIANAELTTGVWVNYTYTIDGDEVTVTRCNSGIRDNVEIPAFLPADKSGKPFTAIGQAAFRDCRRMTQLKIPSTITYIANNAFDNCNNLISVEMSNGITSISPATFKSCAKLPTIKINDGITSIGAGAFENCAALTNFTVDAASTKYSVVDGVLFNFDKTTLVQYPTGKAGATYEIPATVTSIAENAFDSCTNLTALTVAAANTQFSAADGVLFNLDKTKLVKYPRGKAGVAYEIPASVTSIASNAFYGCTTIAAFTVAAANTQFSAADGVLFNLDKTSLVRYPVDKADAAFEVPATVTTIVNGAFSSTTKNFVVTIPKSVTVINDAAFSGTVFLEFTKTTIDCIANSVAYKYAISKNILAKADIDTIDNLTVMTPINGNTAEIATSTSDAYGIVSTVWKNGANAHTGLFGASTKYTVEIVLRSNYMCKFKADLIPPTGYTKIVTNDQRITIVKEFDATSATAPVDITSATVTGIEAPAVGNTQTTAVSGDTAKYTATTTWIKDNALMYAGEPFAANSIYKVIIELTATAGNKFTNATTFGLANYAKSLDSNGNLVLIKEFDEITPVSPDSLFTYTTSRGVVTITNCDDTATGKISIPSKLPNTDAGKPVKIISDNAFKDCTKITKVIMPNSVTTIGDNAFENCLEMTSINIRDSVTKLGGNAFKGCAKLAKVTLGAGITTISDGAFNSSGLTSIDIPNNVTKIGNFVFFNSRNLLNVKIGTGVRAIGNSAFKDCSGISNLVIPNNVISIGDSAFENCTNLIIATLGTGITSIGDSAFSRCGRLLSIDLPDNLIKINSLVFYRCWNLSELSIGKHTTRIEPKAFYFCTGLTEVTIPANVEFIGTKSFAECHSLTSAIIENKNLLFGDHPDDHPFIWSNNPTLKCVAGSTAQSYSDRTYYPDEVLFVATIPSVDMNVTTPITAATPANATTASTYYNVESTIWKNGANVHTGAFVEGTAYTVEVVVKPVPVKVVVVKPKATFIFTADTMTQVGYTKTTNPDGTLTLTKTFPATKATVATPITDVTITGMTDPSIGGIPSTAVTGDATKYTVATKWFKNNVAIAAGTPFELNAAYKTELLLTATAENEFTNATTVPSGYVKTLNADGTIILTKEYSDARTVITNATITGIVAPATQTKQSIAVSGDTAKYTVTSSWHSDYVTMADDAEFLYGTIYAANIVIKSTTNYKFTNATIVSPDDYTKMISDDGTTITLTKVFPATSTAYISTEGDYTFITDGNAVTITSFTKTFEGFVDIPDRLPLDGGKPVTAIGANAFDGCTKITGVAFPSTLAYIGNSAFDHCAELTAIDMPNSVNTFGENAFARCTKLATVRIGTGVIGMGSSAFEGCTSLISINIPDGVRFISNRTFKDCTSLTTATLGAKVNGVGEYVFDNCTSLTTVSLGNKINKIDLCAFRGCSSLTTINIPDSVTVFETASFQGCSSLTSITVPNRVSYIGRNTFDGCTKLSNIIITNGVRLIGDSAFNRCVELTNINIPDSVATLENAVFSNCTKLSTIVLGARITNIPERTFENCTSLSKLTIGAGVSTIHENALNGLSTLTAFTVPIDSTSFSSEDGVLFNKDKTILVKYPASKTTTNYIIPNSVTSLSKKSFEGCNNLSTIALGANVNSIWSNAFELSTSLTAFAVDAANVKFVADDGVLFTKDSATQNKIKLIKYPASRAGDTYIIPDTVTVIFDSSFERSKNLTTITIPDRVTSIGNNAFAYSAMLENITMGAEVTTMGSLVFNNCEKLKTATIGPKVTAISNGLFQQCYSLTNVVIPAGVTSIGTHAFYACSSLTSMVLPAGVASIGIFAFNRCSSLTSINIPDGVTEIGQYTFYACSSLTSMVLPAGIKTIGRMAFMGCSSIASVNIPVGVTTIEKNTFDGCNKLTTIIIPDGVTTIANSAFDNCNEITSIVVPNSVISVGENAFAHGAKLSTVAIGTGVTSIGNTAFDGCNALTAFTVPDANTAYLAEDGVLFNKDKTRLIKYPALKASAAYAIPDTVTALNDSAFDSCAVLNDLIIPDKVTALGARAFKNSTSLKTVTIGAGITAIDNSVFDGCVAMSDYIVVNGNTTYSAEDGVLLSKDRTTLIRYPIGRAATSYTLPLTITNIRDVAFAKSKILKVIHTTDALKVIANNAFENASPDLTLFCPLNSYTMQYAVANNVKYAVPIERAEVTFTAPVVDIVAQPATATSTYYTLTTTEWKAGTTEALVNGTGKFAGGKAYTLTIVLTAKANSGFSEATITPTGFTKVISDDGTTLTLTKIFTATAPSILTAATVTGIVVPAASDSPSTAISGDPTKYTAATTWFKGTQAVAAGAKFEASTVYKVSVVLTAIDGNKFTDATTVPTDYTKTLNPDGTLTLTKTFPATGLANIAIAIITDIVNPAAENSPSTAISGDPTKYTVATTWFKGNNAMAADAKFEASTVYKVSVVLTATENNKFSDTTLVAPTDYAKVISADGLTLTLTKTFPVTGLVKISTAIIVGITDPTTGGVQSTAISGDTARYTAATTWFKGTEEMAADATFENSTVYNIRVVLTATVGNEFTNATVVAPTGYAKAISADGTTLTLTKTFPATGLANIITAIITGIADPVTDNAISTAVSGDTEKYTAATTWFKGTEAMTAGATFMNSTVYNVRIVLTATTGNKFTNATVVLPAGYAKSISTDGLTLTLTKTFPATGLTAITYVTVTDIVAPAIGGVQTTAVSGNIAKYTAATTWLKGNAVMTTGEKFVASTVYKVRIVLTATTGNKFINTTSVPTDYTKVVSSDGTTLTLTKTFPSTKYIAMDMNGDKIINIEDALLALKAQLGIITKDPLADNSTADGILNKVIG